MTDHEQDPSTDTWPNAPLMLALLRGMDLGPPPYNIDPTMDEEAIMNSFGQHTEAHPAAYVLRDSSVAFFLQAIARGPATGEAGYWIASDGATEQDTAEIGSYVLGAYVQGGTDPEAEIDDSQLIVIPYIVWSRYPDSLQTSDITVVATVIDQRASTVDQLILRGVDTPGTADPTKADFDAEPLEATRIAEVSSEYLQQIRSSGGTIDPTKLAATPYGALIARINSGKFQPYSFNAGRLLFPPGPALTGQSIDALAATIERVLTHGTPIPEKVELYNLMAGEQGSGPRIPERDETQLTDTQRMRLEHMREPQN